MIGMNLSSCILHHGYQEAARLRAILTACVLRKLRLQGIQVSRDTTCTLDARVTWPLRAA